MASGAKKVRFDPLVTEQVDSNTTDLLLEGNIDAAAERHRNEDGTVEGEAKVKSNYKSKRTLDSDDEEEDKYEQLHVDDIDGQEDDTIVQDGEIKITPFNMREEMDEGHFDSEGNFIFNKDREVADNWLDNIDWDKAKQIAGKHWEKMKALDDDADAGPSDIELYEIYDKIALLLQDKETITKALKRLGGGRDAIAKRQRRWGKDKGVVEEKRQDDASLAVKEEGAVAPQRPADEAEQRILELTELVDNLVSAGEFEAYGYTKEQIVYKRDTLRRKPEPKEELDMFGDDFEEKEDRKEDIPASKDEGVKWVYKWKEEDTTLHGPVSSDAMLEWSQKGYFAKGVLVRRADQPSSQFYNSSRIDFDLYI